jgi:hypothetical protein
VEADRAGMDHVNVWEAAVHVLHPSPDADLDASVELPFSESRCLSSLKVFTVMQIREICIDQGMIDHLADRVWNYTLENHLSQADLTHHVKEFLGMYGECRELVLKSLRHHV